MKKKKPRNNCFYCNKECKRFGQKFCSNKCQSDLRYKRYIERWLLGKEKGMKGKTLTSGHIRRWFMEKHNEKCQLCGWNKKNQITGKVPLEINHIDGKFTNNKPKNLQLLCPNCHSLTPNFKSLNRGNGRATHL